MASWGDDYESDSDEVNGHDGRVACAESAAAALDTFCGPNSVEERGKAAACQQLHGAGVDRTRALTGETDPGERFKGSFAVEELPISTIRGMPWTFLSLEGT